ncbi:MAG: dephospho-CoA kinase [Bacteroidia bacterium]|nr:dephospho-CoA kinase [Bacteroidia bacterium]
MVLGLTGGIGSGKSTVAQLFVLLGWKHFNSDQAAKALYFEPNIKNKVKALLGEDSYHSNGQLNKAYISSKVFSDPALLKALNALLHPAVKEKFEAFCRKHKNALILKESALLFEAGAEQSLDKIAVVLAPEELRIQRVMERDQLNREQVLGRLKNQMSQEEKMKKADVVIMNDGKQSLIEQVIKTHEALIKSSKN